MTAFGWDQIKPSLPQLCVPLDEWTLRMMHWHFSEHTGSDFWLDELPKLGFDPRQDIKAFEDLRLFGVFDVNRLRNQPVSRLLPRGLKDRPRRVFETGGTTGKPAKILDIVRGEYDVAIYRAFLKARGHPAAGDALALAPSGPHAYGWFIARLLASWHGTAFYVDFDPRWVKKLAGDMEQSDAYIQHLLDQAEALLADNRMSFLFTTSKLLLKLCAAWQKPLAEFGFRAVCTGGTSCTPEEEDFLRETYLAGVDWIDTYGNTLVGHALQADATEQRPRSYHVPPPLAVLRVSQEADWTATVPYGARGRVVATTLLDDLFIPNLLERDSAIRAEPNVSFPWDGVSGVAPLWSLDANAEVHGVEGVY